MDRSQFPEGTIALEVFSNRGATETGGVLISKAAIWPTHYPPLGTRTEDLVKALLCDMIACDADCEVDMDAVTVSKWSRDYGHGQVIVVNYELPA